MWQRHYRAILAVTLCFILLLALVASPIFNLESKATKQRVVYIPHANTVSPTSLPGRSIVTHPTTMYNRSNTNQMDSMHNRDTRFNLFDPALEDKCALAVYGKTNKLKCSMREEGEVLQVHPACWEFWTSTPDVLHRMAQVYGAGGIFGLVAQGSLMSEVDHAALNFILAANPESGGKIVEFGTAMGLTSLYLGMAAKLRDGELITYDYIDVDCRDDRVKTAWLDNMHFKQADILSTREECPSRSSIQRDGKCTPCTSDVAKDVASANIFLVDNGEKIHETSVYAKFLNVGSIIIVHDHCGAQWTEPYEYTLKRFGFHAKYGDYFATMGSCIRAWIRVSLGEADNLDLPPESNPERCYDIGWQS